MLDATASCAVLFGRLVARRFAAAKAAALAKAVERGAPPSEIALAAEACVAALTSKRVTLERSPSAVSGRPAVLGLRAHGVGGPARPTARAGADVPPSIEGRQERSGPPDKMVMGAGKTTVVAPLLALCLADGASLVTAVAPRALVEMTRDVYRSTFSSPVCLKPVFTFSFARTSTVDAALVRRLRFCRDAGGVVVAAPSDVKAFVLKFAELNHETYLAAKKQTVAGKEKKSIVGQISGALTGAEGKRAKRLALQAQARAVSEALCGGLWRAKQGVRFTRRG